MLMDLGIGRFIETHSCEAASKVHGTTCPINWAAITFVQLKTALVKKHNQPQPYCRWFVLPFSFFT